MYVFQTISVYVKRKHKLISNLCLVRNELVISWVKLRWKGLKMPLSAVLKGDNLRLSFLKHIETPVKDYKACGNGLPHWFSVLSDCTCSKPSWKENLLLHAKKNTLLKETQYLHTLLRYRLIKMEIIQVGRSTGIRDFF